MTQKPSYEELERKVQKLEKQVQESERGSAVHNPGQEPYREIFNAAKDTFLIFDMNGVIREVNPAACRMYGYSRDEMIGLTGKDIVREDFRHLFKESVEKASEGHISSAESIDIRKDGSTFSTEVRGSGLTYNGEPHLLAVVRDITERKKAEEALRDSDLKYRRLLDLSFEGIVIHGETEIYHINPTGAKLFGAASPDEIIGKSILDFVHPADREAVLERIQEVKDKGIGAAIDEERFVGLDGQELNVEVAGVPISYKGKPAIQVVLRDITKRRQAEEETRESEEKYRLLFENANDAIYVVQDGVIKFPNPRVLELIGYTEEELAEKPFSDFLHSEDKEIIIDRFTRRLQGEEGLPATYPFRVISKAGDELTVEVNAVRIMWEGRPATLNFARDISRQKKMEEKLQQAQKMEAIATLAGGIAHQFNNALMGIMGSLEILGMDLPEDEVRTGYFDRMKDSGHRMARLTDQLLAYARGGKYRPRDLALGDFVMETLSILRHRLSPGVRVETGFPRGLSPIRADLTQMQMALSAILTNSDEAIEDEGLIKISGRNEIIDAAFAEKHSGLKPGPFVCLAIEDDGRGMDEEARDKVFDPFFTTKFQGRGMGMAAVYGIVMNHDGWISVDSELGRGTLVRIYFPAVEVKVRQSERPKIEPEKGTGTIVLIEDEEVIVEINQAMLERLGYRVLVARTGEEAVQIAETFDGDIDLALLDIKLPDMEGEKLYPLMMNARPNLKVIVCSGYSIDGPAQDILNAGAQDFIQKPFSFTALSEKVSGVLVGR